MIGLETYLPAEGRCLSKIATITRRDEEMELVAWFLQELTDLAEAHDHPRLLTFSGRENDIPWIEQRIEQYRIERPDPAVLRRIEHVDLKVEFYRRTHNDQISLKKLETIFGIEHESSMQSRKVSFILTDIVSRERMAAFLDEDMTSNSFSKFLFRLISAKTFLEHHRDWRP
ncbi:MAG: ribonuclease H-like domain-containing protein [Proteobacteria bacterium]|nr:ribonuclease H-like domain-containing protein [Pseudomonadota bacterium]